MTFADYELMKEAQINIKKVLYICLMFFIGFLYGTNEWGLMYALLGWIIILLFVIRDNIDNLNSTGGKTNGSN